MKLIKSLKEKLKKSKRKFITRMRKRKSKKEAPETFTKQMVKEIIHHAIVWVYLTYLLAYLGKTDVAENLSITVVKVIIYTFISYATKALFENVFKYTVSKIERNPHVDEEVVLETDSDTNTDLTETTSEEVTSDEECVG